MFEKFTNNARRAVFFARYEVLQRGLPEIDTRCLLLGTIRADKDLMTRLLPADPRQPARLRADMEALLPEANDPTSGVMSPRLSGAAKLALCRAADESRRLRHWSIEPRHLLWGLVAVGGPETACLKAHGITLETVNGELAQAPSKPDRWAPFRRWITHTRAAVKP
jgi:ATP-dependent Clp protease ATP-binding subunit ClpC